MLILTAVLSACFAFVCAYQSWGNPAKTVTAAAAMYQSLKKRQPKTDPEYATARLIKSTAQHLLILLFGAVAVLCFGGVALVDPQVNIWSLAWLTTIIFCCITYYKVQTMVHRMLNEVVALEMSTVGPSEMRDIVDGVMHTLFGVGAVVTFSAGTDGHEKYTDTVFVVVKAEKGVVQLIDSTDQLVDNINIRDLALIVPPEDPKT